MITQNNEQIIAVEYKRRRNGLRNYRVLMLGAPDGSCGLYIDEISVGKEYSIKDGATEATKIFKRKVVRYTKKGGKNGSSEES